MAIRSNIPNDSSKHLQVPPDFPRPLARGAVSGNRTKVLLTESDGNYSASEASPYHHFQRWEICEDLARQLAAKAQESKAGKRAGMTEAEILAQYLPRLIAMNWTSQDEANWIIRRTAKLLGWPIPHIPGQVSAADVSSD